MNKQENGNKQVVLQLPATTETTSYHLEISDEYLAPVPYDQLLDELRTRQSELEMQNEELRQKQAALEQANAHYINLYDYAPIGYLTLSYDGIIIEVNVTAAKLLGQDCSNVINRPFTTFITADHKDLWSRHFRQAQRTDGKYGCELPFTDRFGTALYYHLDCLFIDDEQAEAKCYITLTDVTERKLIEAELRIAAAAFEGEESILVTDKNRIIIRVNKAFSRVTGFSSAEAIGKTPSILRSELHDKTFYDNVLDTVACVGFWQGEIWNKRKNGEIYPVLQTITAVRDAAGQLTHYVGGMMDITPQKQAEKVLLDAREKLATQVATSQEELEKAKMETAQINTALKVLLKHREKDKDDAKSALSNEVELIVMPMLKRLKSASAGQVQSLRMIDMIEDNITNLIKTYGRANNLDTVYQKLTPLERRVAAMVKQGQPTKVISTNLNISEGTVNIHRKHIRKKLALDSKTNLQAYLQSLTE